MNNDEYAVVYGRTGKQHTLDIRYMCGNGYGVYLDGKLQHYADTYSEAAQDCRDIIKRKRFVYDKKSK